MSGNRKLGGDGGDKGLPGEPGTAYGHAEETGSSHPEGLLETALPLHDVALSILEAVPDAVVCVDSDGRIVFINPAAEGLWGYSAREVLGAEIASIMVPEDRRDFHRNAFRALVSGTGQGTLGKTRRFPSQKKDGTPFIADISLASFTHKGEDYYLAVTRDVTERHRLEESLREARERLRILHDNARFAVFSYDRNLILTSMNQVVSELLGYTEEELLGRNVLELRLLHPEDYPRVAAAMGQLFAGHPVTRDDLRFFRKDGSTIIVHVIGVPMMDEQGEVLEIVNIAQDVTEQRRMEEELEAQRRDLEEKVRARTRELEEAFERLERSERYFRALIENAHDLIAVLDGDLRIRYLSPSVRRIAGYAPQEVVGLNSLDFIHPEDVPPLVEKFTRQLETSGITERAEYRWRHKDGTYRWQEAVACNLLKDPSVRGIVINARDITERKEAERALKESEERYRSLVETSPDGIVVTDLEGKILMANRALMEILGCREMEEVMGHNVLEFIALEDHARAAESMRTPVGEEGFRRDEYILVRKDGVRRWVEISASLLRDAWGAPIGFTGITRDITESKLALIRLETLNRTLLSLGHDAMANIINIVLSGREMLNARLARYGRMRAGRFEVFTSERAEEGFQVRENLQNYLCYRLLQRGLNTPVSIKDLDLAEAEEDPDFISFKPKEILTNPVYVKGKPSGCLCLLFAEEREFTAADIDVLIMLGRAIAIEEERWGYEEGLREFVDIASHELRHPTALLSGYSQLLKEREAHLDEESREIVEALISSTERLAEISDSLVHASLMERDRFTLRRSRQDVVALAQRVVSEMGMRFPEREFRLKTKGEMGTCSFDPLRVHELLVILLDNAVKFSPPGTEVELEVGPDPSGVLISVLDRGKGVREENRERIFERFYQEEQALYHSEGLGLGLYLARHIAEAHGGRLWHEPRPGGGSIFRLFLPYL